MMANYTIGSIFIFILQGVTGYRILGIFPYSGKSHFDVYQPLLLSLAEKGHEITVISHFPLDEPMKNYKDISMRGTMRIWKTVFSVEDFEYSIFNEIYQRHAKIAYLLAEFGNTACKFLMENQEVHQIKPGQFDVAIVEMFNSDCGLALPYKLNIPYIGLTASVMMIHTLARFGLIVNPSIVANRQLGHGDEPNLWQTTQSLIVSCIYRWIHYYASQNVDQEILSKYYSDLPPLESIARNTSLMLVNTYFPINGVNLYPPNIIEIGGIHLTNKTPKLESEMQKLLDDCDEGVIVFCMGSMIKAVSWPEDKLNAFKSAFAEIPQTIVWKWENETMEGLSKNVKIFKWLSQYDVLRHKNVRGFITHAGNSGITEAVSSGVPVLSIPLYGDQFHNAASAKSKGFGIVVDYKNITIESIRWGLKEILSPRLQYGAERISKQWNDRPLSAVDSAIYWIEHVSRHGGTHLRPPTLTVPWYRYILLDVIALVLFIAMTIFLIFYKIIMLLCRILFKKVLYKRKNQ